MKPDTNYFIVSDEFLKEYSDLVLILFHEKLKRAHARRRLRIHFFLGLPPFFPLMRD